MDTEEHLLPTTKSPGARATCGQPRACSLGWCALPASSPCFPHAASLSFLPLSPDCAPGLAGFGGSAGKTGVGRVATLPTWGLPAPGHALEGTRPCACIQGGQGLEHQLPCSLLGPLVCPGSPEMWTGIPPGQQAGLAGVMCLSSCSLSGRRSRDGTVVSWHGAHRRAWWRGMTLASVSLCLGNRGRGVFRRP